MPTSEAFPTLEKLADGTGYRTRVRFGKDRRRVRIALTDPELACTRAQALIAMGESLGAGDIERTLALRLLKKAGEAPDDEALARIRSGIAKLVNGVRVKPKAAIDRTRMTVEQLGDAWVSGDLNKEFPDQIKLKRSAGHDKSRLKLYIYPAIGSKLVTAVTLDDAEAIMRALPKDLSTITRRAIGHTLSRLLTLAVYPLRIIPATPLPKGFLPGRGERKALAYLYPDEDAKLMACTGVPFKWRLLWGFLMREGMREGEALALTWGDLDVERGLVKLDKNKTDDPRAWPLQAGTAEALRTYKASFGKPAPEPNSLVFTDDDGRALSQFGMVEILHGHLRAIGLEATRPELFKTTGNRLRIRVHDLRGTFVTISLANGKSESWISDRTGHRSSAMINKYKRTARSFGELELGDLAPLNLAIPELRAGSLNSGPGTAPGTDLTIQLENPGVPKGIRTPVTALKGPCPGPG